MSALRAAEARAGSALDRLELALRARATGGDGTGLAQECEQLRRELPAPNERADRLRELLSQAEERIEDAIDRVDEIAAGTPP